MKSKNFITLLFIALFLVSTLSLQTVLADTLHYGTPLTNQGLGNSDTKVGYKITTTAVINISGVEKDSFSDATKCYLYDSGGTSQYAIGTFSGDTCMFNSSYITATATSYRVLVDKAGAVFSMDRYGSASYPIADDGFNWVAGYGAGGNWGNTVAGIYLGTAPLPLNNPPTIDIPFITPTTAYRNSTLNCSTTVYDKDLNTSTLNYTWYNGSTYYNSSTILNVANGTNTSVLLTSGVQHKSEIWNCSVFANDGLNNSLLKSKTITISNTAPTLSFANITLNPSSVYSTTAQINCSAIAGDLDGDSLTYTFLWYKNNATIGVTTQNITNSSYIANDVLTCQIKAYDGTSYSALANSSNLTIQTPVIDTSFTVSLPANTNEITFNATTMNSKEVQPLNQTSTIPFFNITNTGNIIQNFSIKISAIPSWVIPFSIIKTTTSGSAITNTSSRSAGTSSAGNDDKQYGVLIHTTKAINITSFIHYPLTSGATKGYIIRASDNTTLGSASITSNQYINFSTPIQLADNTDYRIVVDAEGSLWSIGDYSSIIMPLNADGFNWVAGISGTINNDTNFLWAVTSITVQYVNAGSITNTTTILTTSYQSILTNLGISASKEIWLYSNFTNASAGTNSTILSVTSNSTV